MYEEALRTLQRKFGQPQAVVSAYLEKLSKYPPVKIHSSESIIDFATTMGSLVGVFKSLGYEADLNSTSLLNQAVAKLPPNLKEAWSFFTVKQSLERPSLQEFNTWLQQKAEAHDRMQTVHSQSSSSPIYSKQPSQLPQQPKIKFTKSFSSSTKEKQKTATINNTSVLCVQELICCTAAANSATKLQANASGLQLRKNCVSHGYKEHIHSANALRNTRVQNKDAKVLTVFCFKGQNACSQSQHHLDRSFKTQKNLHRRTPQSQPQKLVKVFCR